MSTSIKTIATPKFITNVGLITSNGPYGNNIMSAEWTYKISSQPYLMMICIGYNGATFTNIKESKEFGVNIAASDQNVVASISGNNSGKEVDKIILLKNLGVQFYKADTIDVLMVKDAAMNAECRLKETVETGDHCLFIGEVQSISSNEKEPLAYCDGKFLNLGAKIEKPGPQTLEKINLLIENYSKKGKESNT